ncbi:MAG: HEAT repeat domain-containing protein [Cyanobacteria bacterium P01_A01_bin.68]
MQSLHRISAGDLQRFLDAPEDLLNESEETQIAVTAFSETPRSLLEVLVNSDYSEVVEASHLHVNWVDEERGDYREAVSEVLREKDLGENDRLAVELMRFAPVPPDFLSEWVPVKWLIQGLKNEYMPLRYRLQLLERLSQEGELEARLQVTESRETPVSILELLAGDLDLAVRLAVEYNDNCPLNVVELVKSQHDLASDWDADIRDLEELGESRWGWVRLGVAQNPFAPVQILKQLSEDKLPKIQLEVAKNPKTQKWILEELFKHPHIDKYPEIGIYIKAAIAEHPNMTGEAENKNIPFLGRHKLRLNKEKASETSQARYFMTKRVNSPFALAQISKNSSHDSKLTAARNRNTPVSILEQLARDSHETICQTVATNPSLPFNTLLELARNSSVRVKLNIAYKSSYGNTPSTPRELLEILAEDESEQVRAKIAEHPDTPVDILVKLANDSSREVKSKLTANLNTPVEVLTRLGLEENLVNQRNPNTPGIVLAQAVRNMNSKALADFIKHPVQGSQMPSETLTQLATNTNSSVRYHVACHPNTKATVLRQLARDSYIATIRAVASNHNTFPETLEVLSTNPDFTTRHSVVNNLNVPPRILAQIVMSSCVSGNQPNRSVDMLKSAFPGNNNDVLRIIARNPNTPTEALEILARREFANPTPEPNLILPPTQDDSLVQSLAYNPNLTPEILSTLTQDSSVDVRKILVRHPNLTEELWLRLAEDEAVSVRETVANSNQAPVNVLELLASDQETEVRIKVAGNSNTPSTVLEKLAGNEKSQVRTAVASNQNLSTTILEQLANDEKIEVRRAVAKNPNTPENIRESLRDLVLQPNSRQTISTLSSLPRIYNRQNDDLATVLTEYAESDNAFVRFVVLLHPVTPGEILIQGANSASWLERYAVAENQATSLQICEMLARDGNWIVKAAANQSFSNSN